MPGEAWALMGLGMRQREGLQCTPSLGWPAICWGHLHELPVGLDTEIEAWGTERGPPEARPEVRAKDRHVALCG